MNKAGLIEAMAAGTCTKKEAAAALDAGLKAITKALKKKEAVTLVGFGTFKVVGRKARKGVNPQTRETIQIKAKNVPVFKAGTDLKKAVK